MLKIPLVVWIANAAVRWTGAYGDITHQAQQADCSRQTVYDHAQKVHAAVEAEYVGGPTRADLIQENHRLRHEHAQLWDWLRHTIEFPPCKQQEFSVTAMAMGLSLNQTLVLLALIMGTRARPGRSTIQRWIKAAGQTAGKVLRRFDRACHALVLVGCLDEIFFHRRPVLVGVEPASMVWFLGRRASDRQGATWCKELQGWTSLQYVVADAGTGLQAASTDTPFYRLHKDPGLFVCVVTLLAFGCPTQAVVAAFGLDERTVADWQDKAGGHAQAVHHHFLGTSPLDLQHVQADEIYGKTAGGRCWRAMALAVPSRIWLGGVASPIRDLGLIQRLVALVRLAWIPGGTLLICVDGLASWPSRSRWTRNVVGSCRVTGGSEPRAHLILDPPDSHPPVGNGLVAGHRPASWALRQADAPVTRCQ